jgi:small subunit ribosomal protein S8
MIIDPIADMLTRIRNALTSRHKIVNINYSKFTEKIVRLFYRIGYIEGIKIKGSGINKLITVFLKYDQNGSSVIRGIKRASKPGLRIYCNKNKIPIVYNGIGTAILSTSRGLLTAYSAKQQRIGGEIICFIW